MAERASFKAGDLEPALEVQLLDGTTPVDLTNALSVEFTMRERTNPSVIRARGTMSVADQRLRPGVVRYAWQAGDTARVGTYAAEVRVTWPGDRPQTFPSRRYLLIEVLAELRA